MPKRYIVEQGESVDSIAFEHGLFPDTIWDHPENAELKSKRESRAVLAKGDELFIPDKREKTVTLSTGRTHSFKRKGVPARFRIQLMEAQKPLANVDYRLIVPGSPDRIGKSDGNGVVSEWLPPDVDEAVLEFGEARHRLPLKIGHLDPIDRPAGLKQRLNNLGFACGDSDGAIDDATRAAVRRFQKAMNLQPSGELDDQTVKALAHVHDADGTFATPRDDR